MQNLGKLGFWLQQAVPGRKQLIEYGKFLSAQHLPMRIFYLRSRIYQENIRENDRKELQGFINILYGSIRLLNAFQISVGIEIWSLYPLFFDIIPVRDEFLEEILKFEDLSKKFFFVDQTGDVGDRAENLYHLQSKLIADFKFRQVKPKLRSLIQRFEAELGVVEQEEREGLSGCLEILSYLESFIQRNGNSESEQFDTE